MDRQALVYLDLNGQTHLVGRLWGRVRNERESATFEYDARWLEHSARFSLEPALKVGPGPFHTTTDLPMFGAIGDSAPDRWGRALMRRGEYRIPVENQYSCVEECSSGKQMVGLLLIRQSSESPI